MASSRDGSKRDGLRPGTSLGDIVLVRKLGAGAQGTVFEAWQESLGRTVAAKVLARGLVEDDSESRIRFHREAEALARVEHPNIVRVYGLIEAEGRLVQLQELVTGGSLSDWIKDRRSGTSDTDVRHCRTAAAMCRDLARALHAIHEKGIVHRDVKPGNVLLTEEGQPKLGDFGLARMLDKTALSASDAVMGTLHYMSPEQLDRKRGDVDARSDVYGLGAVLYHLLTRQHLFPGRDMQRLVADILTRAPRAPRALNHGVSTDLQAVCLKALEKQPSQRYQSAAEFADDLDAYLAERATSARPTGPVGRVARSVRRLASSTLLLALVLVSGAWLALDALVLSPLDVPGASLHAVRFGVVGVFALLGGWTLAVLLERLAKGARWTLPVSVVVGVVLAAAATAWVREDQVSAEQRAARAELASLLEDGRSTRTPANLVAPGSGVGVLRDYEERWGGRLEDEDRYLLARGYLQRQRLLPALDHAEALSDEAAGWGFAVLEFVQRVLGNELDAYEAGRRLDERMASLDPGTSAGLAELERVADVHRDLGDHRAALDVYERIAASEAAPRRVWLNQAFCLVELCRYDEAARFLDAFAVSREEDRTIRLAFRIAEEDGDVETAQALFDRLVSRPIPEETRLEYRLRLLALEDRPLAVREQLEAVLDRPDARRELVQMAAMEAFNRGEIDLAERAYTRLLEATSPEAASEAERRARLAALVGRASLRLVGWDPSALAEALELAEEAVAVDPESWEAHHTLALAVRKLALAREAAGEGEGLTEDVIRRYSDAYAAAIRLNGMQTYSLNDAAMGLKKLYAKTGDEALVDEALRYVNRALRIAEAPGSDCEVGPKHHFDRAVLLSTKAELLLEVGRDGEACRAARDALELLGEAGDAYVHAEPAIRAVADACCG